MSRSYRFLGGVDSVPATTQTDPNPSETINKDSDFVVILAALLCALICVLGLVAVAVGRCAWIRRLSTRSSTSASPGNKGLKKKIIHALPKISFKAELSSKYSECPICLGEFCAGEEIRVLPQCGHGFHVKCIDTWLGSHSTCPSCRQILVVNRCKKCGVGLSSGASFGEVDALNEARLKQREDELNRYLP